MARVLATSVIHSGVSLLACISLNNAFSKYLLLMEESENFGHL